MFANNFSLICVFPLIPFMVAGWLPSLTKEELGYRAGFLTSSWQLGILATSFFWAKLSDKVGRRPVLIFSAFGAIVGSLSFVFSPSFGVALAARIIWGVLTGTLAVVKTYLSEVLDESNMALGFQWFGTSATGGRVLAPVIGGLLSRPADHFPSLKHSEFFLAHPYVLAAGVPVAVSLVTICLMCRFLTETVKFKKTKRRAGRKKRRFVLLPNSATSPNFEAIDTIDAGGGDDYDEDDDAMPLKDLGTNRGLLAAAVDEHGDEDDGEDEQSKLLSTRTVLLEEDEDKEEETRKEENHSSIIDLEEEQKEEEEGGNNGAGSRAMSGATLTPRKGDLEAASTLMLRRHRWYTPFFNRKPILSCLMYAMLGLSVQMSWEILPLWLLLPVDKMGFGFVERDVGVVMSVSAPFQLIIQFGVYGPLAKRLGLKRMFSVLSAVSALMISCMPFISYLNQGPPEVYWMFIAVCWGVFGGVYMCCFTTVFVLINNSVCKRNRASVNGISQTLVGITRLLGPLLGGACFAAGTKTPIHPFLAFIVASVPMWAACVCSILLPSSCNSKMPEEEEEEDGDDDDDEEEENDEAEGEEDEQEGETRA